MSSRKLKSKSRPAAVESEAPGVGLAFAEVFIEAAAFGHRLDYLRHEKKTARLDTGLEIGAVAHILNQRQGVFRFRVASAPLPDGSLPLYAFDLSMAALVVVPEDETTPPRMSLDQFMFSPVAVSAMLPIVRSALGDLTMRGRFGPLWLNPLNPKSIVVTRMTPELIAEVERRVAEGGGMPLTTKPKL